MKKIKYWLKKLWFILSISIITLISLPFYITMIVCNVILIFISFLVKYINKNMYLKFINTILKF
jgi:hypothetical protein